MCSEKTTTEVENPYSSAVPLLAKGVLSLYEPSLNHLQKHLEELNAKQESTAQQLNGENKELVQIFKSNKLHEMFTKINHCQSKLISIRKELKHLYERSSKLKKHASRLQQIKEEQKTNK